MQTNWPSNATWSKLLTCLLISFRRKEPSNCFSRSFPRTQLNIGGHSLSFTFKNKTNGFSLFQDGERLMLQMGLITLDPRSIPYQKNVGPTKRSSPQVYIFQSGRNNRRRCPKTLTHLDPQRSGDPWSGITTLWLNDWSSVNHCSSIRLKSFGTIFSISFTSFWSATQCLHMWCLLLGERGDGWGTPGWGRPSPPPLTTLEDTQEEVIGREGI